MVIGAVMSMHDRNNPNRFPESVTVGLSQLSNLPSQVYNDSDGEDWCQAMEELSDMEDYQESRKVLSRHYNELSEAFNNSKEEETLESEFMKVMNDSIVCARGSVAVAASLKGRRISMLPPGSKRRKTHGTKHY
jgi:hypothetical protein